MRTKKLLSLALALVLCLGLAAPALAAEAAVTEVVPFGKYDYVTDFSDTDFSNGLARVRLNGKWGYIDKTGKEVVPCRYDYVRKFSDGFAAVAMDSGEEDEDYTFYKWGLIDTTGKEVVPCKYDYVENFSEGLAAVNMGGKYYADEGHVVGGKCGFIDATGKEVIPCKYDKAFSFSEGLAVVRDENGNGGLIDKTGKEVVPIGKYRSVSGSHEGLAQVRDENWKLGFIDKTGKEVVSCKYDNAEDFSEGLAKVQLNDKWGYIDKTGKEIVPCKYDNLAYGEHNFSNGFARVELDHKYGLIDTTGKEIVPIGKYDVVGRVSEGLAYVQLQGKVGCIDTTGKEVIPFGKYDNVSIFSEGLAMASLNGKWGYIDATGKEVVPFKYDNAMPFDGGLARVAMDTGEKDEWDYPIYKYGVIAITAVNTAYPSTQEVDVDGQKITFQCYALKDGVGMTNYIKVRDLADILNGSAAQFQVGWDGNITITTGQSYTKNGSEQNTPFSGERTYEKTSVTTLVNGKAADLDTFLLKDDNGGGYTYYKLRDLGKALGITVDWTPERGIYIETK